MGWAGVGNYGDILNDNKNIIEMNVGHMSTNKYNELEINKKLLWHDKCMYIFQVYEVEELLMRHQDVGIRVLKNYLNTRIQYFELYFNHIMSSHINALRLIKSSNWKHIAYELRIYDTD